MSQATLAIPIAARGQQFYVGMAAASVVIAVIGFAPTYWIPMARGTLAVPPIIYVHSLFFYGWTLLFWRQTWLAASGQLGRHRELGVASVAVATGMCFIGLGAAIGSLKHLEAIGIGDEARAFTIIPVTGIALFAVLFAIALLNVKNPEVHKRLMLIATVSLLQAALGRLFVFFFAPPQPAGPTGLIPPPVMVTTPSALVTDLLIVFAMIHDRRTTGRVHPVYWIAGGFVLAVQLLRVPLSTTSAWMHVTNWLVALAP